MAASSKSSSSFLGGAEKARKECEHRAKIARDELMIKVEIYHCKHPSQSLFKLDNARLGKGLDMMADYVEGKFDPSLLGPRNKKKKR